MKLTTGSQCSSSSSSVPSQVPLLLLVVAMVGLVLLRAWGATGRVQHCSGAPTKHQAGMRLRHNLIKRVGAMTSLSSSSRSSSRVLPLGQWQLNRGMQLQGQQQQHGQQQEQRHQGAWCMAVSVLLVSGDGCMRQRLGTRWLLSLSSRMCSNYSSSSVWLRNSLMLAARLQVLLLLHRINSPQCSPQHQQHQQQQQQRRQHRQQPLKLSLQLVRLVMSGPCLACITCRAQRTTLHLAQNILVNRVQQGLKGRVQQVWMGFALAAVALCLGQRSPRVCHTLAGLQDQQQQQALL
jgi:hypothetical protein